MWAQFLGQEDLLEEGMATKPQYCCLESPMGRAAWWATLGGKESDMTAATGHAHTTSW